MTIGKTRDKVKTLWPWRYTKQSTERLKTDTRGAFIGNLGR